MKYQILFTGKNKKNINLSSTELAQRMVNVKKYYLMWLHCLPITLLGVPRQKWVKGFVKTYPLTLLHTKNNYSMKEQSDQGLHCLPFH